MAGARRTRQLKKAFLAAYRNLGNISQSAKKAHIDRTLHYLWLRNDPAYEKEFKEAHEEACGVLEDEARRRAVQGNLRPVFQGGKLVGRVREYSDTLLIFLMKGAMPDKYADRSRQEVTGKDGGPVVFETGTPDQNEKRIAELLAKAGIVASGSISTQSGGTGGTDSPAAGTPAVSGGERRGENPADPQGAPRS